MRSLREAQAEFYARVTRPGPVEGDASDLVTPGERLDVYAEMYFCRLHDVLAEQHERTFAALGARRFRARVAEYLAGHRPTGFSIGDAGDAFPAFLATREPAWLAELARLERLHATLFEAADARAASLDELAAIAPEELERRAVVLIPAHALVELAHDVAAAWEDPTATPAARPTRLLVWREELDVRHRVVDVELEWAALVRCARGATIGELAALAGGDVDEAARRLFALLGRWVDERLLVLP